MNEFNCSQHVAKDCEQIAYSWGDTPAGWYGSVCGPCLRALGFPQPERPPTIWRCTRCGQNVPSADGHAEGEMCPSEVGPTFERPWLYPLEHP